MDPAPLPSPRSLLNPSCPTDTWRLHLHSACVLWGLSGLLPGAWPGAGAARAPSALRGFKARQALSPGLRGSCPPLQPSARAREPLKA